MVTGFAVPAACAGSATRGLTHVPLRDCCEAPGKHASFGEAGNRANGG